MANQKSASQARVETIKNVVLSKKDNETRELLEKRFLGKALIVTVDKPEKHDLNRAYMEMYTENNVDGQYLGKRNLVIKDKLNQFILEQTVNKLNNEENISLTALDNAIAHSDDEYLKELYKRNGGLLYFSELTSYANSTCKGLKDTADTLINIAKKDKMIDRVVELLGRVDLINSTMDDFRDEFHEINIILENIAETEEGQIRPFSDILEDWLDLIYQRKLGTLDSRTLTLGDQEIPEDQRNFVSLDEKIGGFREGQMVVIAARPGVGKTAFVLNVVQALLAQENGKSDLNTNKTRSISGVIFSLEMNSYDLVERMAANSTGTTVKDLRSNEVSDATWHAVQAYIDSDEIKERLYINDDPSLKIIDIQDDIDKLVRKGVNVDFVVIDYLQLINTDSFNRQQAVATISRQLKIIAKKYNTVVFALSQLNRDIESRVNKTPGLADLRESGQIEQDADIVLMLSPEVETTETEEEENFLEAATLEQNTITVEENPEIIVDLTIAKNRSGSRGIIKYIFDRPYQSFVEAVPNDLNPDEIFGEEIQDKLTPTPKSEEGKPQNDNLLNQDDLMDDFGFGKDENKNYLNDNNDLAEQNLDNDNSSNIELNSNKNLNKDLNENLNEENEINQNESKIDEDFVNSIVNSVDDNLDKEIQDNVSQNKVYKEKENESDVVNDLVADILDKFDDNGENKSQDQDLAKDEEDIKSNKSLDDSFWATDTIDLSNQDLGF